MPASSVIRNSNCNRNSYWTKLANICQSSVSVPLCHVWLKLSMCHIRFVWPLNWSWTLANIWMGGMGNGCGRENMEMPTLASTSGTCPPVIETPSFFFFVAALWTWMPGWLNHSECKAFWNKPFNRCFKDPVHQDDRLTLWNGFSYFDARRSKGKSRRLWVSWFFICIERIFHILNSRFQPSPARKSWQFSENEPLSAARGTWRRQSGCEKSRTNSPWTFPQIIILHLCKFSGCIYVSVISFIVQQRRVTFW